MRGLKGNVFTQRVARILNELPEKAIETDTGQWLYVTCAGVTAVWEVATWSEIAAH